jgi:hypothetical protein
VPERFLRLRGSFGGWFSAGAFAISATSVRPGFAWAKTWAASWSGHADGFCLAVVIVVDFELYIPLFILKKVNSQTDMGGSVKNDHYCLRCYFELLAHQSAISLAENAALVHEDILSDGTSLRWGNETISLSIGEPFDASFHLFRHVSRKIR